jgi:outer membrane protein OmpA-like peptidoglycan-associated protein
MRWWIGTLAIACVLSGCAKRPSPSTPSAAGQASARPPVAAPAPSAPPLTDRELAQTLAREGVGRLADDLKQDRSDSLGTEIRETPRGVIVTFRHIFFAFDRADLTPVARREIERMAAVLNHPRVVARKILLEGHADAIGTDAYNMRLSLRRANSVAQELIASGLRRGRLGVEGYGERRPVAPNTNPDGSDNPAGRARNRRVEAVIQK